MVLDAVFAFLDFVHPPEETATYIRNVTQTAQQGMLSTMEISYGNDFVPEADE
ncbi:hypothetical protein D3C83_150910 [compost metagenome]